MLAQALGEYGLLEGLSQGVVRLSNWADAWMGEWASLRWSSVAL